ncbi:hypothetical protein RF11_13322 [Thelohanellus kitauei]|uniref:Uncharacterized protein n=1 Tax=Thelohanellus kitauei TaxID=669202 RepID=A0A0C2NDL6_THEKT|nr:hypothetical protein RF11_13322 [Thelohanellus kitauei]
MVLPEVFECKIGNYFEKPSRIKLLEDDICITSNVFDDQEIGICGLEGQYYIILAHDTSVSLLIGKNIKFISLKNKETAIFPLSEIIRGNIIDYAIDDMNNIFYILNKTGIFRIFYVARAQISRNTILGVVFGANILGFEIDRLHNQMYYYTNKNVFVCHTESLSKKALMKATTQIYFIKTFISLGYIFNDRE